MANKDHEQINLPKDGNVTIVAQASTVTEKEIHDDRQAIINQLHRAYVEVANTMKPYQDAWNNSHILAMEDALWTGFKAGCTEWGEDNADLLKKETWVVLADKIGHAAGTAYDAAAQYAVVQQKKIVTSVNEALHDMETLADHPVDTLKTWTWHVYDDTVTQPLHRYKEFATHAVAAVGEAAEMAKKTYHHKDAILNLPNLVSRGDINGIQAFIDGPLKDIDPELATSIKNNPNRPILLEIIADHNTALAYMNYANLFYEAVPPNFYGYVAAKGGTYLLIEVILLVVTALFTGGAGTAARLAALAARITAAGSKLAKIAKQTQAIGKAIDAFTKMLKVFEQAVQDLWALGKKLNLRRSRPVNAQGASKTEIQVTRKIEERKHYCTCCGSTEHDTPRQWNGTVQYN